MKKKFNQIDKAIEEISSNFSGFAKRNNAQENSRNCEIKNANNFVGKQIPKVVCKFTNRASINSDLALPFPWKLGVGDMLDVVIEKLSPRTLKRLKINCVAIIDRPNVGKSSLSTR